MKMCSTSVEPIPSRISTPNRSRKRSKIAFGSPASRNRLTNRAEVVLTFSGQQGSVIGRDGKEERRPVALDLLKDTGGVGPARNQYRRGADVERKVEPISEAIGEKELR